VVQLEEGGSLDEVGEGVGRPHRVLAEHLRGEGAGEHVGLELQPPVEDPEHAESDLQASGPRARSVRSLSAAWPRLDSSSRLADPATSRSSP